MHLHTISKTGLFVLVSIALIFASTSFAFAGGNGSVLSPYLISNCTELQNISSNLTASYMLNNSIDCSDTINWVNDNGTGFTPIGNLDNSFNGTLDGQGYNISHLYINSNISDNDVGIFAYTQNASFSNFGIINLTLISTGLNVFVGGLVGEFYYNSTMDNVFATGNVTGNISNSNHGVGLLAGSVGGESNITNSYAVGSVSAGDFIGGLVGRTYNTAIINNSYFNGSLNGSWYLGGLASVIEGTIVNNSYSIVNITITILAPRSGGLIGSVESNSVVDNSYSTGYMYLNESNFVGGLVGVSDGNITNSHSSVNLTADTYSGGLIGENDGIIYNSYSTGNVSTDPANGYCVGGFTGSSTGPINNSYATGNVSGYYYLGGFAGCGDGGFINNSYSTGDVFTTYGYAGGLTGYNDMSIYSSYSTGNVYSSGLGIDIGGLSGLASGGSEIYNSYARGSVEGNDTIGGLVGYVSNSDIFNSYSTGTVIGNINFGGLIGRLGLGSVNSSFYDNQTSNQSISDGGTGKTSAQMKMISTFTDLSTFGLDDAWDFSGTPNDDLGNVDIWSISSTRNDGYPYLGWQLFEMSVTPPSTVSSRSNRHTPSLSVSISSMCVNNTITTNVGSVSVNALDDDTGYSVYSGTTDDSGNAIFNSCGRTVRVYANRDGYRSTDERFVLDSCTCLGISEEAPAPPIPAPVPTPSPTPTPQVNNTTPEPSPSPDPTPVRPTFTGSTSGEVGGTVTFTVTNCDGCTVRVEGPDGRTVTLTVTNGQVSLPVTMPGSYRLSLVRNGELVSSLNMAAMGNNTSPTPSPEPTPEAPSRDNSMGFAVMIIIILVVIGGVAYYYMRRRR